ncbi:MULTISPECIES: sensor histidine kinase [unclassified Wenzhouxiangella]|uniref:sensor histidine kinase n=1 Tax=unclassified Wenzhouxiangella TaxID=2613841 RepID=UPI0011C060EA|nr:MULTISPECIES: histidine kinase [unclassified Wenzhouxiangella]
MPSSNRNRLRPGRSRFCDSSSSLLVFLLAGILLALCLSLIEIHAFSDFWPVFGLKAVFIVWVCVVVVALHCSLVRYLPARIALAEATVFFLVVQLVVGITSLIVIGADPWLSTLALVAHENPLFFLLRNMLFALVGGFAVSRYLALQSRWQKQVVAESRARLDALQASIRPHFLFNALNTIASLVHDKPDQAEQATLDLSDLLRTGLRSGATHSLADELDLVRGYLRLEALRLGERLNVDWELADDLPLEHELPALLIQPLIENAVVHGISRLPDGGTLSIRGGLSKRKRLRFVIENPVPAKDSKPVPGNRTALENIRQRLELAWEEGAHLRTRRDGNTFRVELLLPLE